MLKVLDNVFYQKLTRDNILPPADIKNIFSNLEEIIQLHGTQHARHIRVHSYIRYAYSHPYFHANEHFSPVTISEQMAAIRKRNETSVVDQIGDDLLSWVSARILQVVERSVTRFQLLPGCVVGPVKSCLNFLFQFSREEEEKMMHAVGTFCSNQPFALELIKSRQKKDPRFLAFMHVRPRFDSHWEPNPIIIFVVIVPAVRLFAVEMKM